MAIAAHDASIHSDRRDRAPYSPAAANSSAILAVASLLLGLFAGCAKTERDPENVPPLRPAQLLLLERWSPKYDSSRQMLQTPFRSPGYHSQTPAGAPVHPTRESLVFALALMQRADAEPKRAIEDRERAMGIIRRVLALQDRRPGSATCGVWPWHAEEPIDQMESPDLNWADFCGASICQILIDHGQQLPADLRAELRSSLRLAAEAIERRNVGPDYTNVAVMGGGVCVVAGEFLSDQRLLDYGRRRLQRVAERARATGNFSEYNSPPYSNVVIAECERVLNLAEDEPSRVAADAIRRLAWQMLAESYHAATGQLAGPHSRTSRIRLRGCTVDFLSERVGIELPTHPTMINEPLRGYAVVAPLPCPPEYQNAFRSAPSQPVELVRTFVSRNPPDESIIGVTWMDDRATLGSVNQSSFWTQRKPVIGYWKSDQESAVAFRLRFLRDGNDFASMGLRSAQIGPRALVNLHAQPERGDWHRTLDRPTSGEFIATDFRLRCELSGAGVRAEQLESGVFSLSAGDHRLVIHALPSRFQGHAVQWRLGEEADQVYLDGVCYSGAPRPFRFDADAKVDLAVGLELLDQSALISGESPQWIEEDAGKKTTQWFLPEGETLRCR